MKTDEKGMTNVLEQAVRECLRATELHVHGVRSALFDIIEGRDVPMAPADAGPDWQPPPSPTFLDMCAARDRLRMICADPSASGELLEAARDYLAEHYETWYGYNPDVPEEVERSRARSQRHEDVRVRLERLVGK